MDKKQLIKTIITVLPVFLVPLIVERKRIKDHPDVKKATDATVSASKTVANKSVQFKDSVVEKSSYAKDYVADKKHNVDQKRELKRIAKAYDPAYIEKKGEKLEKENRKEAAKLDKILQKNINKRHKEEEKVRQDNKKQRIKDMKKANKHMEKVGLTPGKLDDATEKKGEKLEKENRKDIKKLDKLLQKNIDKRHKEEEKAQEKNKKNRLSEFKKYKDYVAKSVVKQNNEDKGK
ncbi:hypothetical protein CW746_00505 [Staphylococcus succinus]|uniref:hypothetical protein n=1 Tax=Staphylococcus succinus TaxID=61015 RepID=UPI000C345462|nr:hypothetical protein [Staphylococcus succinus]MBU0436887.1 hypothetical protein [Staphylococcus succinus]MEB7462146.1 hypothetical protein [Staphylococcus succinus]PKI22533.1 hypothetical protein CW746_00505 [Staphylococcus succinus]PTJ84673.1 hypothetical protein BU055_03365 [Staphylococcus succinus]